MMETLTSARSVKTARQACSISSGWTSHDMPHATIWLNSRAAAACNTTVCLHACVRMIQAVYLCLHVCVECFSCVSVLRVECLLLSTYISTNNISCPSLLVWIMAYDVSVETFWTKELYVFCHALINFTWFLIQFTHTCEYSVLAAIFKYLQFVVASVCYFFCSTFRDCVLRLTSRLSDSHTRGCVYVSMIP